MLHAVLRRGSYSVPRERNGRRPKDRSGRNAFCWAGLAPGAFLALPLSRPAFLLASVCACACLVWVLRAPLCFRRSL